MIELMAVETDWLDGVRREEYDYASDWWLKRGQATPCFDCLPMHGVVIVKGPAEEADFEDILMLAWYYADWDSKTLIPDWLVSNPANTMPELLAAARQLNEALVATARANDIKYIRAFTWNQTIAKYAERFGFEMNSTPVYHYGKALN